MTTHSDMQDGDVLTRDGRYFVVSEIPEEALPVPEFEVGQEVELVNGDDPGPRSVIGPPFYWHQKWRIPVHRDFYVPSCEPASLLRSVPSTITKTIRMTWSESDKESIRTWLDCAPKGVTVEVEDGPDE